MLVRARPFIDEEGIKQILTMQVKDTNEYAEEFASKFARFIGVDQCYTVHQGRVALLLALKSLPLQRGDEVIVQSFICGIVVEAILQAGGVPVLADISLDDFNLSPKSVEHNISDKTKAIIMTHTFGVPANIDEFQQIASKYHLFIIEDCAHTIVSKYNDRNVGSFGDLAMFSFNFDKPMTTGNGGILVVNNADLREGISKQIKMIPKFSIDDEILQAYALLLQYYLTDEQEYCAFLPFTFAEILLRSNLSTFREFQEIVLRKHKAKLSKFLQEIKRKSLKVKFYRRVHKFLRKDKAIPLHQMNAIRCQIGLLHFNQLSQIEARRLNLALQYQNVLSQLQNFRQPQICANKKPSFVRYPIVNETSSTREKISQVAMAHGIEIGNYNWPRPIHRQEAYRKKIKFCVEELQNSEYLSDHILNLPTHHYVTKTHCEKIARILKSFVTSPGKN